MKSIKIRKVLYFSMLFGLIIVFSHCSYQKESPLILISLDGFRYDYLEKANTPNLDYLVNNGVKAKGLIPVFPSKTFPNHFTTVTGLYTENHGIIANNMYDPEFDASFSMGNQEAVQDGRWWGGEPIWITAEKQGKTSATYFWPGSEAEYEGMRATYWKKYDDRVSNTDRVQQILSWLDLPENERPAFFTLYFSDTDYFGHRYGPDSPEVVKAITHLDSTMGLLLDGLETRNIKDKVNIIITADHGMTELSPDRVIFLDDYIDLSTVRIVDWLPVTCIPLDNTNEDEIYNKLKDAHPNFKVYRKSEIPDRFHYKNHRRVPAIVGIPDEGWSATSHSYFDSNQNRFVGATHGYDNTLKSMQGLFVAFGPAFKAGIEVDAFENVHIYNLMAKTLGLKPAPNDGDFEIVKEMLR
ncbi:alkaline phosphatase family protein [candidate division KSB1 bacterium]|nr:alkaline phosphatase family protein [candidate division KSB1 bacterium]